MELHLALKSLDFKSLDSIRQLSAVDDRIDFKTCYQLLFLNRIYKRDPVAFEKAVSALTSKQQGIVRSLCYPFPELSDLDKSYPVFFAIAQYITSNDVMVSNKLNYSAIDWLIYIHDCGRHTQSSATLSATFSQKINQASAGILTWELASTLPSFNAKSVALASIYLLVNALLVGLFFYGVHHISNGFAFFMSLLPVFMVLTGAFCHFIQLLLQHSNSISESVSMMVGDIHPHEISFLFNTETPANIAALYKESLLNPSMLNKVVSCKLDYPIYFGEGSVHSVSGESLGSVLVRKGVESLPSSIDFDTENESLYPQDIVPEVRQPALSRLESVPVAKE